MPDDSAALPQAVKGIYVGTGGSVTMDAAQATVITRTLAMAWITQAQRTSWPNRLSAVRGFARHLSNMNPDTETPPAGIFPSPKRRRPYIYTEAEG